MLLKSALQLLPALWNSGLYACSFSSVFTIGTVIRYVIIPTLVIIRAMKIYDAVVNREVGFIY